MASLLNRSSKGIVPQTPGQRVDSFFCRTLGFCGSTQQQAQPTGFLTGIDNKKLLIGAAVIGAFFLLK